MFPCVLCILLFLFPLSLTNGCGYRTSVSSMSLGHLFCKWRVRIGQHGIALHRFLYYWMPCDGMTWHYQHSLVKEVIYPREKSFEKLAIEAWLILVESTKKIQCPNVACCSWGDLIEAWNYSNGFWQGWRTSNQSMFFLKRNDEISNQIVKKDSWYKRSLVSV